MKRADLALAPVGPRKRLRPLGAEHRGNLYTVMRNDAMRRAPEVGPVVGLDPEPAGAPMNGKRMVSIAAWLLLGGIALLGYFAKGS